MLHYLVAVVLCAIFAVVYESMSHGVYSAYMICLFAFPLVLGCIPALVLDRIGAPVLPSGTRELWGCGVLTLVVGSCLTGVMEIYGTSSPYTFLYWYVGAALLLLGALVAALGMPRNRLG